MLTSGKTPVLRPSWRRHFISLARSWQVQNVILIGLMLLFFFARSGLLNKAFQAFNQGPPDSTRAHPDWQDNTAVRALNDIWPYPALSCTVTDVSWRPASNKPESVDLIIYTTVEWRPHRKGPTPLFFLVEGGRSSHRVLPAAEFHRVRDTFGKAKFFLRAPVRRPLSTYTLHIVPSGARPWQNDVTVELPQFIPRSTIVGSISTLSAVDTLVPDD